MRLPIWKGIDHREDYILPFTQTKLRLRPLCQIDVDTCYWEALDYQSRSAQTTVIKIHSGMLKKDDKFPDDARAAEIQSYYDEVMYRIVASGAEVVALERKEVVINGEKKTVEKEETVPLSRDDVVRFPYGDSIKRVADRILRLSGVNVEQAEQDIKWFLTNSDGAHLAELKIKYLLPITDKAWKLTPLQYMFLKKTGEKVVRVPEAKTQEDILAFFGGGVKRESGSQNG